MSLTGISRGVRVQTKKTTHGWCMDIFWNNTIKKLQFSPCLLKMFLEENSYSKLKGGNVLEKS